ncbi:DUF4192 domain-containing protein [Actinokineospora enzanensis]|uniref:DUF4192 domain-containing protein n=1 Tax=Actinokineospora enzanensis TaxID=155975 RepID=UPI0003803E27|nr:DUF4192 domain-containing protein [Actinokineospora enzanensis]
MTTTDARRTDELLAAIPYLLGFHPVDSLVVLTVRPTDTDLTTGPIVRADLPVPGEHEVMAEHVTGIVGVHEVQSAVFVVVGGPDALPYRGFVNRLTSAFTDSGVSVEHALWTPDIAKAAPWQCYDHPDCAGTIADPDSTALAARLTVQGVIKYPTRQAMADSLGPDPDSRLERRSDLIDALLEKRLREESTPSVEQEVAYVHAVISQFHDRIAVSSLDGIPPISSRPAPRRRARRTAIPPPNDPPLSDEQIARLAVALCQSEVRDELLATLLTNRAEAAQRLWTRLVRATPAPERAEPACLLAITSYLEGHGVLARIAVENALAADPSHAMALLLAKAAQRGLRPEELRGMLEQAARETEEQKEEEKTEEVPD